MSEFHLLVVSIFDKNRVNGPTIEEDFNGQVFPDWLSRLSEDVDRQILRPMSFFSPVVE